MHVGGQNMEKAYRCWLMMIVSCLAYSKKYLRFQNISLRTDA